MDHALVCQCNGDRTLRHNALRNLVYQVAALAGLMPEKEKVGLLPPRPDAESIRGEVVRNGRRPADIWAPQWQSGSPVAWNFAMTSALRADSLFATAEDPSSAVVSYERQKREYLGTTRQCEQAGLDFLPLVAEAHSGAWGPTARTVWRFLSKAWAATSGLDASFVSAVLAQRTSTTLQRENARAVLRRMVPLSPEADTACPQGWHETDAFGGD